MATVPFTFVPRVVSKHARPWQGISSPSPSPDPTADSEPHDDGDCSDVELSSKGKGKEKAIESVQSRQSSFVQDIPPLISLALSDYNIWFDPDLRSKLDACFHDESFPDAAGFVPINYLLRRAPFRCSFPPVQKGKQPEPSEADVVKALRTYASHTLETRMRLPFTSSPVWDGAGKTSRKKDVGGYEVRRKDWLSLRVHPSREWSRARWDDLTIYMEGIPPSYRTIGGIARFTEMLLPPETKMEADPAPCFYVQHVTLPSHYLDKPGDVPKCKGYALVTFSTASHAEALLRTWPWTRRHESISQSERVSEVVKDAFKYGLRIISKARWNALNREYLEYKQSLVDEINACSTEIPSGRHQDEQWQQQECSSEPQNQRRTTAASSYPFDCLIFVRNVHPETNKTALKALFGRAFQDGVEEAAQTQTRAQLGGTGLDYIDFNKGMDTCHLRLASPRHAMCLTTYFGARSIAQADGLDALGRTPVEGEKPISLEIVQGTKEALYWEKVPEKVRRQAVDKVIKTSAESTSPTTHTSGDRGTGQKKRARDS